MKLPLLLLIAFLLQPFFPIHSQENWRLFTTQDGLSSNMVYTIFESNNGDIWVGTAEGVDLFTGIF